MHAESRRVLSKAYQHCARDRRGSSFLRINLRTKKVLTWLRTVCAVKISPCYTTAMYFSYMITPFFDSELGLSMDESDRTRGERMNPLLNQHGTVRHALKRFLLRCFVSSILLYATAITVAITATTKTTTITCCNYYEYCQQAYLWLHIKVDECSKRVMYAHYLVSLLSLRVKQYCY